MNLMKMANQVMRMCLTEPVMTKKLKLELRAEGG
jgi:hypothetical protein